MRQRRGRPVDIRRAIARFAPIEGAWEGSGNYDGVNGFFVDAEIEAAPAIDGIVAEVRLTSVGDNWRCEATWRAVDARPLEFTVDEAFTGGPCPGADGVATIRLDPYTDELRYETDAWNAQANLVKRDAS